MTSEDFLSEFIDTCITKGYASPAAMCQEAQSQIDAIEEKIKENEGLRNKQSNLRQIIRQFVGEPSKRTKKAPMIMDLSQDDIDPYVQEICIKICALIEAKPSINFTPYEIRDAVVTLEDHKIGYSAIKSLWDRGIIQRIDGGKTVLISKGPKWNERPNSKSNFSS